MREEGRIFQFPCNLQLPAQACGSGGAGFPQLMPVHPQTVPYGPLQLAGHRSGGLSAAGRAPIRLERVFSTGLTVMQDANNYGLAQIFPDRPLIPHTGIWLRWGLVGSTSGDWGAGVCVLGCGLSLKGKGEWSEVTFWSATARRNSWLSGPPSPPSPNT